MRRISNDKDIRGLIDGKSGDLQKFINFYVAPVINEAKSASELTAV